MDIIDIPFNRHLNIVHSDEETVLSLSFEDHMKNHIGTFHASAQFALAEACSGLALQKQFPELENSVVPILRNAETKFKKPAASTITAHATTKGEACRDFKDSIENKGRAKIAVAVEVRDESNTVTMIGTYEWFIQKMA